MKQKTKEEIVRLSWLTELRRQGHRKCLGTYCDDTLVCALGLLGEIGGLTLQQLINKTPPEVGELAGLTEMQAESVVARNDGSLGPEHGESSEEDEVWFDKHTFAEIADVVEGWFHAPQ